MTDFDDSIKFSADREASVATEQVNPLEDVMAQGIALTEDLELEGFLSTGLDDEFEGAMNLSLDSSEGLRITVNGIELEVEGKGTFQLDLDGDGDIDATITVNGPQSDPNTSADPKKDEEPVKTIKEDPKEEPEKASLYQDEGMRGEIERLEQARRNGESQVTAHDMLRLIKEGTKDQDSQAAGQELDDLEKYLEETVGFENLSEDAIKVWNEFKAEALKARASGNTAISPEAWNAVMERMQGIVNQSKDVDTRSQLDQYDNPAVREAIESLMKDRDPKKPFTAEEITKLVEDSLRKSAPGIRASDVMKDIEKFVEDNHWNNLSPTAQKAYLMYENLANKKRNGDEFAPITNEEMEALLEQMKKLKEPETAPGTDQDTEQERDPESDREAQPDADGQARREREREPEEERGQENEPEREPEAEKTREQLLAEAKAGFAALGEDITAKEFADWFKGLPLDRMDPAEIMKFAFEAGVTPERFGDFTSNDGAVLQLVEVRRMLEAAASAGIKRLDMNALNAIFAKYENSPDRSEIA